MTFPNKPRGTQDIFPPRSLIYQKIQQIAVEILHKNNYQPLIFPTFEYRELFTSSLGSTTDIVHKEMFTFLDKKGRCLALRPEGTASVARLVSKNKLIQKDILGQTTSSFLPKKYYYWANMFRYERPQKGRYREFWQLGVEFINSPGIIADYQILKLASEILGGWGIKNFTFTLNYLGNSETKARYKEKLKKFIDQSNPPLCVDCQRRYQNNPLRILDCLLCEKKTFPNYKTAWEKNDRDYVDKLNQILTKFNFSYDYDYYLVRGLDYYTGLIWEINLGQEKTLLGGGRYDHLYSEVNNFNIPATGFAVGIDRLVDYLESSQPASQLLKTTNEVDIFFFISVSEFYFEVLEWERELAKHSLVVDYNLKAKKIKNISQVIDYYQPKLLVILGKKELKTGKICLKDWKKKVEFLVEKENLVKWIHNYWKISPVK